MTLNDLEKCFNRAILLCFSKKKFFFVFPILVLCGILIVFCRALSYNATGWMVMSLVFLPIFLTSGILLSLGVLLIRIYYHEVKNLKVSYNKIIKDSWNLIIGTTYLSLPPILIYLLLWIIFGIFVVLKEIPNVGNFIGVILAFAPFLIIFVSILLSIFNLGLLFYVSPAIALKASGNLRIAKDIFYKISNNLFSSLVFFFFAIFPIALVVGLLSLSAILTRLSYLVAEQTVSVAIQWFFIMLPFCAFLTPAVTFFFNFAAESYNLLDKKERG